MPLPLLITYVCEAHLLQPKQHQNNRSRYIRIELSSTKPDTKEIYKYVKLVLLFSLNYFGNYS